MELNVNEKMPPNLKEVINEARAEIFASLNCINIGKVETVNAAEQTVEVSLQIKRKAIDGSSTAYPILVDCPYFVLQGGGAYIDMPVTAGDYCIVLFNDRDIDTWWDTANVTDPNTSRKHSLSDGIALIGINPKTSVLEADGAKTRIINADGIELNGNTKSLVTYAELNTAMQSLMTKYNADMLAIAAATAAAISAAGLWSTPLTGVIGTATLDLSSAETTTIKTGG